MCTLLISLQALYTPPLQTLYTPHPPHPHPTPTQVVKHPHQDISTHEAQSALHLCAHALYLQRQMRGALLHACGALHGLQRTCVAFTQLAEQGKLVQQQGQLGQGENDTWQAPGALRQHENREHTAGKHAHTTQQQPKHQQGAQHTQQQHTQQDVEVYCGWYSSMRGWLKQVMEQLQCTQMMLQEVALPFSHAGMCRFVWLWGCGVVWVGLFLLMTCIYIHMHIHTHAYTYTCTHAYLYTSIHPPSQPTPPPHIHAGDHKAASPLLHAASTLAHAHTQLQPLCKTMQTLYTTLPHHASVDTHTTAMLMQPPAPDPPTAGGVAGTAHAAVAGDQPDTAPPTSSHNTHPLDEPIPTPLVLHTLSHTTTTLQRLHTHLKSVPGAVHLPGWCAVVVMLGDACRAQQPWVTVMKQHTATIHTVEVDGGVDGGVRSGCADGGKSMDTEETDAHYTAGEQQQQQQQQQHHSSRDDIIACIEHVQLAVQAMRRALPTTTTTTSQQQEKNKTNEEEQHDASEEDTQLTTDVDLHVDLVNAITRGTERMCSQRIHSVVNMANHVLHACMTGQDVPVVMLTNMLTMLTAAFHRACLEFVVLTKAVGKLGYVSASVLAGVLQEGFCMPEGQEGQDGMVVVGVLVVVVVVVVVVGEHGSVVCWIYQGALHVLTMFCSSVDHVLTTC